MMACFLITIIVSLHYRSAIGLRVLQQYQGNQMFSEYRRAMPSVKKTGWKVGAGSLQVTQ